MKTIFNIPSKDFENLNNFEVYQNNDKTYSFSIETIYDFDDKNYEKYYVKNILSKFCEWCVRNDIDIFQDLNYNSLFNNNNKFLSLEELYAYFKTIINGYILQ